MTARSAEADVVLDEIAVQAERRALLAELAAERFGVIRLRRTGRPYAKEIHLARQLGQEAARARELAEQERTRCARRPPIPMEVSP